MSLTQQPTRSPIAAFGVRLHEVLDGLRDVPAWSMTADEQRSTLGALASAEARLAELRLRVLVAADRTDIAADTAATSTTAWVAHHTRQVRSKAHADLLLAQGLDADFTRTRAALGTGSIGLEQARAIVRAVAELPELVPTADRARAERHLVEAAAEHDAAGLRRIGRGILEVIDPEAADLQAGRRLEAEHAAAARSTYLHLYDNGDGTHTGHFKISTLHTAMRTRALHAFTSPRRRPGERGVEGPDRGRRTRSELMGEALCALLERVPADLLPRAGGLNATVVVLLDYDKMVSGLGAARLDTGEEISAGLARRLMCESGVVPAVYRKVIGGPSAVLDLGRKVRFHTEPQRLAMTVRDRGCTAEGCDRPPGWTEAHHDEVSWADGGGTSVDKGRLLCPFHHGRAHSPTYEMTPLGNGQVRFHRRT